MVTFENIRVYFGTRTRNLITIFFVTRKPPIYSRRKTYSVSSKQRTTSCGFASKHAEQSGSSAVGRTLIRST